MSVSIQGLTKIYGTQRAVDSISFEAKAGEVLGFLGPNGAGKTTTMKIISCFIPQNEGIAKVCGFDTKTHPIEVRQRIGYLPEHNPLYKDMYVREYLSFVGGLHKLANKKQRIEEMIERTGLEREQHKYIGALSKGYRQRVGLAQAMLHNPDVLILDEPTSGLDPNQLADIRTLIKDLGKEKTVIFSSHIMQEVQAICDRVVIINQGKVVANDTVDVLRGSTGNTIIKVEFLGKTNVKQLEKIKGVKSARYLENNRWALSVVEKEDVRPHIFRFAVDHNLVLLEMNKEVSSIENVFQLLTK